MIEGINKIYYYKTADDFFKGKQDSIVEKNIVYDYGKVSYIDKKSKKKIKFHLHKDSSIFAFRIVSTKVYPIYAINNGEKRYGVYLGGSPNLFLVFYSRGNLYSVNYDPQNYVLGYSGSLDEFGYYLVYSKKDFTSKKNGDIEFFIKDNDELYRKYVKERADATTYNWNKSFILKQAEYMRIYNN
jgi:hypothetical protein